MYRLIDYGAMVRDRRRIDAWRRALASVITPSTVVLDLGAGLGTFTVLACKLGAARVYAVDAGDVITVAEEIARVNGVTDRVRLLQARSTEIELPEKVDVIVSDLAGALPLFEEHLPSIIDARERLLAPGGVLLPQRSRLFCAPVSSTAIDARIREPWHSVPDVDLGPAEDMALQSAHALSVAPEDLAGEPRIWSELDYALLASPNAGGTVEWTIAKPVHAIALWFESTLYGEARVSSGPWSQDSVHATLVLPLVQPLEGHTLRLTLQATLAAGRYVMTWHARTERDAGSRQSTFLSEPRSAASLVDRSGAAAASAADRPEIRRRKRPPLHHGSFRVPERVLARPIGGELLLLDTASGLYHVLNETGAKVWELLQQGADADAIAAEVAVEFDVAPEQAASDVAVVVAELFATKLIEPLELVAALHPSQEDDAVHDP